jgi:hypothetical protein
MPDLSTLDTIIALVIVILVLSLIVQSIQSLIKKLLKLKSATVLDSIEDLFKYIDTEKLVGRTPKQLLDDVTAEFKKLGRVSFILKNPMLDSIAKGDLQNILRKLHGDKLKADVETWFDTVMQSFDERYTRHMKSIALIVSFMVVIILNANFFNVYRNIAASDVRRAAILQQGEVLQKRLEEQSKANPQASPGGASGDHELANDLNQFRSDMKEYGSDYGGMGFPLLRPQQIRDFVLGHGYWEGSSFSTRFLHGSKVLMGWTIMALLLSVGAPFWQDTLESLFGLKNLIRQRSGTKNVEEESGGQQKP